MKDMKVTLHHSLLKLFDSWSYRFQIHKSSLPIEHHANPARSMCNLGAPGITFGELLGCVSILMNRQGFTTGIVLL
jgi:hypothetical protein